MSDEDIKPEDEANEPPSIYEPKSSAELSETKGVGFRTVLFCSAIAAILGVSGGTYFGGMAAQHSEPELPDYSQDISAAQKDVATLTAKLNRIEHKVETLEEEKPTLAAGEIDSALLETQRQTIEDLQDRLTVLEQRQTLQPVLQSGDGSDEAIVAYSDDLILRVEALEAKEPVTSEPVNLKPIRTRIEKLEQRLSKMPLVLPPFPREAVLKAIEEAKVNEPKGWFARTFGGQLVIQDADILARLDRIEENVALQNISAIKADIASLPENVQTTLAPWLQQVERIGNSK